MTTSTAKKALEFLAREPIAVAEAIRNVIIALVVFNVLSMTEAQFGALMLALGSLLALVARSASTPNVRLPGGRQARRRSRAR